MSSWFLLLNRKIMTVASLMAFRFSGGVKTVISQPADKIKRSFLYFSTRFLLI